MPLDGDRKLLPLVKTAFNDMWATFSPDGQYIAYQSNESGQFEIYVQEFPEARTKSQISTDVGNEPYWKGDGRELFYRSGPRMIAVPVQRDLLELKKIAEARRHSPGDAEDIAFLERRLS